MAVERLSDSALGLMMVNEVSIFLDSLSKGGRNIRDTLK